jgi:hypothetical protein
MFRIRVVIAAAVWYALVACSRGESPARPSSVPHSAVWAGGPDGGAWIDCQFASKEPYVAYSCHLFQDDGHPWASGTYVLADVRYARGQRLLKPTGSLTRADMTSYDGFDGVNVYFSGARILIPHGVVEFPFGDGHGKRATYLLGKEVSEEVQY